MPGATTDFVSPDSPRQKKSGGADTSQTMRRGDPTCQGRVQTGFGVCGACRRNLIFAQIGARDAQKTRKLPSRTQNAPALTGCEGYTTAIFPPRSRRSTAYSPQSKRAARRPDRPAYDDINMPLCAPSLPGAPGQTLSAEGGLARKRAPTPAETHIPPLAERQHTPPSVRPAPEARVDRSGRPSSRRF